MVHHSFYGDFAIRKGDWKLLFTRFSGVLSFPQEGADNNEVESFPEFQLNNLSRDPGEKINLCLENREKVKQQRKLMKKNNKQWQEHELEKAEK
jgi:hypothetical protein